MRLLPFTLILGVISLSFCAQKEASAPAVQVINNPPSSSSPITTNSDTSKKLVWADEFDKGTRPDTNKWTYNIGNGAGGWGNNEQQYYTNDSTNARIENGKLIIEARKENKGGKFYTSARMLTQGKASWTYGTIEVRAKLPKGMGTWPAIWMLGDNINTVGWPTCGEIDIMEHVGKEQGIINWSAHSKMLNWPMGTQRTNKFYIDSVSDNFHSYKLNWTKDYLQFYVDNTLCYTVSNEGKGSDYFPFIANQFLILNLAIGGNMAGSIIDETMFPIRMEVDYVRVYQ
jgi:beta-glucanase (GH16 family)